MAYFIIGYALPFSFYVDVKEIEWPDVCLNDNKTAGQVRALRDTAWTIPGDLTGEVIFFDENKRIETTIKRGVEHPVTFTYENNLDEVHYNVEWDKPFTQVGEYGAQDTITIYPLPFIEIEEVFYAEDNIFNVIECYTETQ